MAHIRYLTEKCKDRYAGTEPQLRAARYICGQMSGAGISCELKEFFGYGSIPEEGSLTLTAPARETIGCGAVGYSRDLPDAGYLLADAGDGTEECFLGRDLSGKIALVNSFTGPATPVKAAMAQEAGAAGLILITGRAPVKGLRTFRAFKGVWGNPDRASFGDIPRLCAVSISYEDGMALRETLSKNHVTAKMHTRCATGWVKLYEPVAVVKAEEPADEFILITGHVDAWSEGATDNASGVALMIELAKYFQRNRGLLRRNLVFMFYDGHEVLEATGSSCLAEAEWDRLRDCGVLEMNIDSPGQAGAERYRTFACHELTDSLNRFYDRIGIADRMRVFPITRDSDRSFMAMGLPGFLTIEDGRAKEPDAAFGWWSHTREDRMDKLDVNVLEETSELFLQYILEFAGSRKIPYSLSGPVKTFLRVLREEVGACGNRLDPIGFGAVIGKLEALAVRLEALDRDKDAYPGKLMPVYRRILREMAPVFYTVSDRYGQDWYGDVRYEQIVPRFEPIRRMARTETGSGDYYLLYTECVRIRNRLSDFVNDAERELSGRAFPDHGRAAD